MHTLKGRVLVTILSVSLSVAILIFGCAISSTPDMGTTDKNEDSKPEAKQNNIPIQGAITHVHEPDGSLKTTIDIVIGKEFTGNLPEDIDSISVTGPKGDLTLEKSDFSYYPQFRDFWISIPGSPAYVGKAPTYRADVPSLGISLDLSDHNSVQGPIQSSS